MAQASPLPADLRAIPLVDPEVERTIGLVVSNTVERSPVIAELLSMFEPFELVYVMRRPVSAVE